MHQLAQHSEAKDWTKGRIKRNKNERKREREDGRVDDISVYWHIYHVLTPEIWLTEKIAYFEDFRFTHVFSKFLV